VATIAQLKDELTRLIYARGDIASADALLSLLALPKPLDVPESIDAEDVRWGLWTAAVVSYARPFGSSRLSVGKRWRRFVDEPDLVHVHRNVMRLRHTVFAHTDSIGFREVVWSGLAWKEQRASFNAHQARRFKSLCRYQTQRLSERIDYLTSHLTADAA
jgi:hypothetical protein